MVMRGSFKSRPIPGLPDPSFINSTLHDLYLAKSYADSVIHLD